MASLLHYKLVTDNCYVNGIYKFYKVFTDGTTCWNYTYCWEEDVYDAIKHLPVPVIYNEKDAKEHFKKLKTEKERPHSALYTWTKRHDEILESCSKYEGLH